MIPPPQPEPGRKQLTELRKRIFVLVTPEVDFDVDLYCYRVAVLHGGLEAPAFHRFDRLLVEATAQLTANPDDTGLTIRPNDQP